MGCRLSWKVSPTRSSRRGLSHRRQRLSLAIEPAQLSHPVFKQRLTFVLLVDMLQETSISRRQVGVGNWTALRTAKLLPALPGLLFWPWLLLAVAELAGPLMPQRSPRYAGSGRPSSRNPGSSELTHRLRSELRNSKFTLSFHRHRPQSTYNLFHFHPEQCWAHNL